MRSLDYLIRLYPNKTGKELLEIQNRDKANDEKEYQKLQRAKIEAVDDLNNNGGYFRGSFGLNRKYMYKITNAELSKGEIVFDVEKILVVESDGELRVDRTISRHQYYSKYSLFSTCERITEKEWSDVYKYIENIGKIWPSIKNSEECDG